MRGIYAEQVAGGFVRFGIRHGERDREVYGLPAPTNNVRLMKEEGNEEKKKILKDVTKCCSVRENV